MTTIAASWVAENPQKGNLEDLLNTNSSLLEKDLLIAFYLDFEKF